MAVVTPEWVTAAVAAATVGVSERTLQRWADEGLLTTRVPREGRGRLYSAAQMRELAAARTRQRAHGSDRHKAKVRAYSAAMRQLTALHRDEFDVLYAKACAQEGVSGPPAAFGEEGAPSAGHADDADDRSQRRERS